MANEQDERIVELEDDIARVGRNVISLKAGKEREVYTKVIVHKGKDDNGNEEIIEYPPVGSADGNNYSNVLDVYNPFGTEEMARDIFLRFRPQEVAGQTEASARSPFRYQDYVGQDAYVDPASELGDGISLGLIKINEEGEEDEYTGRIYSGIYNRDTTFGVLMPSVVEAPAREEEEHELEYMSQEDRKFERSTAYTMSRISQTSSEILLEVEEVERGLNNAVDDISNTLKENLIPFPYYFCRGGIDKEYNMYTIVNSASVVTGRCSSDKNGVVTVSKTTDENRIPYAWLARYDVPVNLEPGKYVLSASVEKAGNTLASVGFNVGYYDGSTNHWEERNGSSFIDSATPFQFEWTTPEYPLILRVAIRSTSKNGASAKVKVQLERGEQASVWHSPRNSKASQFVLHSDEISARVTKSDNNNKTGFGWSLTDTAWKVGSYVNGSLSPTLTANKDGLTVTGSGTFSGNVTASSGKIAGFTISGNNLYNGMTRLDDTENNGVWLGTDGIALGKGVFNVTNKGVLTAKSGTVGGWTIISDRIYKMHPAKVPLGSAGVQRRVDILSPAEPSATQKAFLVRHKNYDKDGNLDADFYEDAYITYGGRAYFRNGMDDINSDSGKSGFFFDTSTGIALGGGKFKVTNAGKLTAADVTITGGSISIKDSSGAETFKVTNKGVLTATSGTVGGFEITASSIKKIGTTAPKLADFNVGKDNEKASIMRYGYELNPGNGTSGSIRSLVVWHKEYTLNKAKTAVVEGDQVDDILLKSNGTGNIGGFVLTTSKFYKGTSSISNTTPGFFLGSDISSGGIRIYNSPTNMFMVKMSGEMTLLSGMSGIDDTQNTSGMAITPNGIALGGGKFKVKKDGTLTAKSVDLSGKITATAGNIGGFNIESDRMEKLTAEATAVGQTQYGFLLYAPKSAAATNIVFRTRHRDCTKYSSNTPTYGAWVEDFKVAYNGTVTANNLKITGGSINLKNEDGKTTFNVTDKGVVSAVNMKLTGTLTIGSKTIDADDLRNYATQGHNAKNWLDYDVGDGTTRGSYCVTGAGYGNNYNKAVTSGTADSELPTFFKVNGSIYSSSIYANFIYKNNGPQQAATRLDSHYHSIKIDSSGKITLGDVSTKAAAEAASSFDLASIKEAARNEVYIYSITAYPSPNLIYPNRVRVKVTLSTGKNGFDGYVNN